MIEGLFQPTHLIVILLVALLVLGPKRLPGAGKALGTTFRDFKDAISGDNKDDTPAVQQYADQPVQQAYQPPVAQPVQPVAPVQTAPDAVPAPPVPPVPTATQPTQVS
jgi:sec-independent protein translocase protein TatA